MIQYLFKSPAIVLQTSRSDQISIRRVPVDWPREAEEKSDQNGPLFERSEFRAVPLFSEHRRIRACPGEGRGQSSGLPSFGYFFWAKQEK